MFGDHKAKKKKKKKKKKNFFVIQIISCQTIKNNTTAP